MIWLRDDLAEACKEIERASRTWRDFRELRRYNNLDECPCPMTDQDEPFLVKYREAFVGWSTNYLKLMLDGEMSWVGSVTGKMPLPREIMISLIEYKLEHFDHDMNSRVLQDLLWDKGIRQALNVKNIFDDIETAEPFPISNTVFITYIILMVSFFFFVLWLVS